MSKFGFSEITVNQVPESTAWAQHDNVLNLIVLDF